MKILFYANNLNIYSEYSFWQFTLMGKKDEVTSLG